MEKVRRSEFTAPLSWLRSTAADRRAQRAFNQRGEERGGRTRLEESADVGGACLRCDQTEDRRWGLRSSSAAAAQLALFLWGRSRGPAVSEKTCIDHSCLIWSACLMGHKCVHLDYGRKPRFCFLVFSLTGKEFCLLIKPFSPHLIFPLSVVCPKLLGHTCISLEILFIIMLYVSFILFELLFVTLLFYDRTVTEIFFLIQLLVSCIE